MHKIKRSLAKHTRIATFLDDVVTILVEQGEVVKPGCEDDIVCTLDNRSLTIAFTSDDKTFYLKSLISDTGYINFKDTLIKCPSKKNIPLLEKINCNGETESNNLSYMTAGLRLMVAEIIIETYPI